MIPQMESPGKCEISVFNFIFYRIMGADSAVASSALRKREVAGSSLTPTAIFCLQAESQYSSKKKKSSIRRGSNPRLQIMRPAR